MAVDGVEDVVGDEVVVDDAVGEVVDVAGVVGGDKLEHGAADDVDDAEPEA